MEHPILENDGLKKYALAWSLICVVHVVLFYFYYGFKLEIAFYDAFVHNVLFALVAPGFWYIVRFSNTEKGDYLALMGTHVVAIATTTLLWSYLSWFVLTELFYDVDKYLQFLDQTFVWRLIIGVVFYSLIILIFYLIQYYLDLQEKSNREFELKALLNESELNMLKSQINPHFIFNSLNSISALTISMPQKAQEMVIKLSDFLRYAVGKDTSEMNSLSDEIENIARYLDIEKVRFGDKLVFDNQVENDSADVMVPNLILQPLFENAIKYGVYESLEKVTISLSCERMDDMLHIRISNNYDADAVAQKGAGIGLENIRKRLLLTYQRTDLLSIENTDSTFAVILKIPTNIIQNEEN
ncbi:MAG: histidine kinase [Cyclobacteriaceae bacterium]